ncbi:unnamed protein product [Lactuca saligna]|uniref:Uncharacterized protein n=1 Tax=Lactuca saligna TaxID=75948 RepID=A0AA35ZWE1_LACSI|nr:unnamed protein product [Lactuca saligna]
MSARDLPGADMDHCLQRSTVDCFGILGLSKQKVPVTTNVRLQDRIPVFDASTGLLPTLIHHFLNHHISLISVLFDNPPPLKSDAYTDNNMAVTSDYRPVMEKFILPPLLTTSPVQLAFRRVTLLSKTCNFSLDPSLMVVDFQPLLLFDKDGYMSRFENPDWLNTHFAATSTTPAVLTHMECRCHV